MTATALARRLDGAMLGGVASGLADRYAFDVTVVRVAVVLLAFATGGLAIIGYLLLWLLLPAAPATPAGGPAEQASHDGETTPRGDLDEVVEAARIVADNLTRAAREATDAAQTAAKELAELASRATRAASREPSPAATATVAPDEGSPTVEEEETATESAEEAAESSAESYAWGDVEQGDTPEEGETAAEDEGEDERE